MLAQKNSEIQLVVKTNKTVMTILAKVLASVGIDTTHLKVKNRVVKIIKPKTKTRRKVICAGLMGRVFITIFFLFLLNGFCENE